MKTDTCLVTSNVYEEATPRLVRSGNTGLPAATYLYGALDVLGVRSPSRRRRSSAAIPNEEFFGLPIRRIRATPSP